MDRLRAIREAKRGGELGFAWLFEAYRGPVYRFIRRRADLGDDGANDVLQNTFIRAFRAIHQLEDDERFEPWLLSIARREVLRALERRARPESSEGELEIECDRAARLEEQAETERMMAAIRDVAGTIEPIATRETAFRYYFREPPITTEALAVELGIPHATVRKRLYSFREKVKAQLSLRGMP